MCVWLAARERAIECHVGKVHVLAVQQMGKNDLTNNYATSRVRGVAQ